MCICRKKGKNKLDDRNCMNQTNTLKFRVTSSVCVMKIRRHVDSAMAQTEEQPHVSRR
jgi:hypothetical protein